MSSVIKGIVVPGSRVAEAELRDYLVDRELINPVPIYGGVFDGVTDTGVSIQAMLDSGPDLTVGLPASTAKFATGLTWTKARVALKGRTPALRGNVTDTGPILKYTGTGTALTLGVSPGASGDFLTDAHLENIRLKLAAGTAIGIRLWMPTETVLRNVHLFGSSGAGVGMKLEGPVRLRLEGGTVTGVAASGVPADYLSKGVEIVNGFGGSPPTTTTFDNYYFNYCVTGVSTAGFTTFRNDTVFEANTTGLYCTVTAVTIVDDCWFEANISQDIYFDVASETHVLNCKSMNAGARQNFFGGNTPKIIVLQGNRLSSSHANPRLFEPTSNFAGTRLILRDNIFPASFTIGGGNLSWENVTLNDMAVRIYTFRQTAVAANTTYRMRQDSGSTLTVDLPTRGNILGTRTQYSGTISAGNYSTGVELQGVAVANLANAAVTMNVSSKDSQYLLNRFTKGQKLQATVATSSLFAATGGEFITAVIVALGDDGL